MKQMILIKTTPDRYNWLNLIMNSLYGYDKYPIFIYSSKNPWFSEPAFFEYIGADEVVLLHDSIEILAPSMFDLMFETWKEKTVAFVGATARNPNSKYLAYAMQMGKYSIDMLKKIKFEKIITKSDDYRFEESYCKQCSSIEPDPEILTPDFDDVGAEEVFLNGRTNKKIKTKYYIKYKGIFTGSEHI